MQELVRQTADKAVSEFFSPESLGDFLGVPTRTVYSWNYTGTGPPYRRLGKHIRYRRSDVEKWLESQTRGRSA